MSSALLLPVFLTALVVCRECLPDYDVSSLPHVVSLLDKYLDTFSPRWEVVEACKAGLSRRALEYLAARHLDWANGYNAAEDAVTRGFMHVLEWLNDCYPDRTSWGRKQSGRLWSGVCLMDLAVSYGQLPVLEWLHTNCSDECTEQAMDKAAMTGRLDIVQWLRGNRSEGCTTKAMRYAALHSHIDILVWLHEHRDEGCTKEAMDVAAACGHIEVVEWLHANRDEGCTKEAMNLAAANGHLSVARFLHENHREGCTSDAMRGHLEVVRWLYENRSEGHPGVIAQCRHFPVVEYLWRIVREQRRGNLCIREATRLALENGHVEVYDQLQHDLNRQRLQ